MEGMINRTFLVPSYQRPYVWSGFEVEKLLMDCLQAYIRRDDHYYIGTILLCHHDAHEQGTARYELIDGQQRFTTLWLIALAFKLLGSNSHLLQFLEHGSHLRFDFSIRVELKSYLESLLHLTDIKHLKKRNDAIVNNDYVRNVHDVIIGLVELLKSDELSLNHEKLDLFGNYLYSQIKFVVNETPKTNLNKLFTTINSSGIQLNQSDILKSHLLKLMDSSQQLYAKIWEACEPMDHYFESNVRSLFSNSDWFQLNENSFSEFNESFFQYKPIDSIQSNGKFTIAELLESQHQELSDSNALLQDNADEGSGCESIISFPLLLLHTLRIYLLKCDKKDFETVFHEKNLIEAFHEVFTFEKTEHSDREVKKFFLLLWKVRFLFDKHVVKWHQVSEKEKIQIIATVVSEVKEKDKKYFRRNRDTEARTQQQMLQSVLYFIYDNNTQYWLTPYLLFLLEKRDDLKCLEELDNILSTSYDGFRETGWKIMKKESITTNFPKFDSGYPHITRYWFQKLEYVLWKTWDDKSDPKYRDFRITSKNSVEHVFPQNEENRKNLKKDILDSFGNLGLLNVGENSSYSNQDVGKKKIDFDNKPTYDSLKLMKLYHHQNFDEANTAEKFENLIKQHQQEMITQLKIHYRYA